MALRLLRRAHKVVGWDMSEEVLQKIAEEGGEVATSIEEMVRQLEAPRVIWVMLPSGEATEDVVKTLARLLSPSDVIIEGGNSNYRDTQRRALEANDKGVYLLDCGTSGGVWGLTMGYCLTIGGNREAFSLCEPVFKSLSPDEGPGPLYAGASGAGHFVKMVHNGIEYGMMQAYAEGLEILAAKSEFDFDIHSIANVWRNGSVVRSWLLDLIASELEQNPDLSGLSAFVQDSGEGRWTVRESVDLGVPAPVISAALQVRFQSRQDNPFGGRLLAAMRRGFGGHDVKECKNG